MCAGADVFSGLLRVTFCAGQRVPNGEGALAAPIRGRGLPLGLLWPLSGHLFPSLRLYWCAITFWMIWHRTDRPPQAAGGGVVWYTNAVFNPHLERLP